MKDINDKDGSKLVSLIYDRTIYQDWEKLGKIGTVSDLVEMVDEHIFNSNVTDTFGGEMAKEEFL